MSTELSNGVIIPEEYSDDWYDEMSINLRKLNDVITAASDNATDIQRLDTAKANQSDLTALTSRVSQNETDIIALQTAVSGALKREIVQTLPTEDISTTTIYMIRNSQSSGTNIYDEYMYINSQWELIGTSATDFSNYYTKNETDNLLSGKVDNSTLGSYYTKTESDNLLSAKANQTDLTALSGRVTQTETDITALQTAVSGALKREIVQSLPTQDISTTTIYMIRNTTTSGDNIYDEYMYINNLWELIGTSATDFSNYYTKTEIDTLLSGKADDNSVVHTSENETISGDKAFNNRLIKNIDVVLGTAPSTGKFSNFEIADNNKSSLLQVMGGVYDNGQSYARFFVQNKTADDGTGLSPTGTLRACGFSINLPASSTSEGQGSITPRANKTTDFGLLGYQWRNLWCEKLFLNGTQLDPSAFALDSDVVHTSGNETIGGAKTFSDNLIIYNSDDTQTPKGLTIRNAQWNMGESGGTTASSINFVDKNSAVPASIIASKGIYGQSFLRFTVRTKDSQNNTYTEEIYYNVDTSGNVSFRPWHDNTVNLGASIYKWKDVQTNLVNGLTPSSLSMPSTTGSVDISGYVTDLTGVNVNNYTPLVNGYIVITCNSNDVDYIKMSNNLDFVSVVDNTNNQFTSGILGVWQPCVAGIGIQIRIKSSALKTAKFIPCQGNI